MSLNVVARLYKKNEHKAQVYGLTDIGVWIEIVTVLCALRQYDTIKHQRLLDVQLTLF